MTQYKSHSMQEHLRDGWSVFNPQLGEYITAVPPQMRTGDSWYSGTADAICQNLSLIKRSGAKNVIILSGDHIYRMDYSDMIRRHEESSADVTVACMEVDLNAAQSFGVMSVDDNDRIYEFQEKPLRPRPIPGSSDRALASMGIYVFRTEMLSRELCADHDDPSSSHDFGKDILPRLIHTHRVFGYRFGTDGKNASHCYWQDVGTIDAYYQANMDLLSSSPPLDLYSEDWTIKTYDVSAPPVRIGVDSFGKHGEAVNSLLSNGVIIEGGIVKNSILSTGVRVASGALVENSILFDGVRVGEGTQIRNCIIDKNVHVPPGFTIGINPTLDAERFTVSDRGIVVVPKDYRFAATERKVPPATVLSARTQEPELVPVSAGVS